MITAQVHHAAEPPCTGSLAFHVGFRGASAHIMLSTRSRLIRIHPVLCQYDLLILLFLR